MFRMTVWWSILEVDTCSLYINESRPWKDNGDGTFTDMWGVGQKLNPDGYYYNMCFHPMEHVEEPEDWKLTPSCRLQSTW